MAALNNFFFISIFNYRLIEHANDHSFTNFQNNLTKKFALTKLNWALIKHSCFRIRIKKSFIYCMCEQCRNPTSSSKPYSQNAHGNEPQNLYQWATYSNIQHSDPVQIIFLLYINKWQLLNQGALYHLQQMSYDIFTSELFQSVAMSHDIYITEPRASNEPRRLPLSESNIYPLMSSDISLIETHYIHWSEPQHLREQWALPYPK